MTSTYTTSHYYSPIFNRSVHDECGVCLCIKVDSFYSFQIEKHTFSSECITDQFKISASDVFPAFFYCILCDKKWLSLFSEWTLIIRYQELREFAVVVVNLTHNIEGGNEAYEIMSI